VIIHGQSQTVQSARKSNKRAFSMNTNRTGSIVNHKEIHTRVAIEYSQKSYVAYGAKNVVNNLFKTLKRKNKWRHHSNAKHPGISHQPCAIAWTNLMFDINMNTPRAIK
jgi:hypothetical protein